MADYSYGGGEEDPELRKLNAEVLEHPDDFERWEKLVRVAENPDGGLNRNSDPQAIASARDVYDRFLAKYPLFFGYWKKYADMEFAIAGTEAAEMIYERGIASVGSAVDLWTNYCAFKTETCHDVDVTRELFERGADSVGLDFLGHMFWDKYLEFEERKGEQPDQIFDILSRIVHIPLHQYARYFERYQKLAVAQPVEKIAPTDVLRRLQTATAQELSQEPSLRGGSDADFERALRTKISAYHMEIFNKTQNETTKRWAYEGEIKRSYFHVTEIEDSELANWNRYLDFEEQQGDYARIKFLYERVVTACAHYDEFWHRYARWMYAQEGKEEEVRNIFQRASCFYTPIARPKIRMQWALFEETCGRPSVAAAIYEAVLIVIPNHLDAITSLASLQRRQAGYEASLAVYQEYLNSNECSQQTKGAIVEHMAVLASRVNGNADAGREMFQNQEQNFLDSEAFWSGYLNFEEAQKPSPDTEAGRLSRIKAVHEKLRRNSRLSYDEIKELSQRYLVFLADEGGLGAAKEYMDLDAEVNGPASIVPRMKNRNLGGKTAQQIPPSLPLGNGHVG